MDETADTGATGAADTAAPTCPSVRGTGCAAPELQGAACTEDGEPEPQVEALPGDVKGGACSCEVAAMPSLWWGLVLVALVVVRRARWVLPALLLAPVAWGQVDAQQVRIVDGGDFAALTDADLGPRWTGAATLSLNHARGLVVLEGVPDARVVVDRVTTRALSGSMNLGGVTRLGFHVPWHWPAIVDGDRYSTLPGDVALWIAVPVTGDDNPIRGSWTVQLDLPAGRQELYLGDPGVVRGIVAVEAPAGPLRALGNLSVNFHREVPLPGAVYGSHWGYGLGLRAEPAGPLFATLELVGEAPVKAWAGVPAQYPLNSLLSVGTVPTRVLSLSAGLGTGLSRGIGSASWRATGVLDVRPRTPKDTDGDGISDLRDLCRQEPEDLDGFRDGDGCPDPDNDQDGFLDGRDDCPDSAENLNDHEDWDGCPERVTFLTLRVAGGEGLEQATVRLGSDAPFVVLPGESVKRTLELDTVELVVTGTDHVDWSEELLLSGRERLEHEVRLQPIAFGEVAVVVIDPDDQPIAGAQVRVGDQLAVPVADGPLRMVAGTRTVWITAEGWRSEKRNVEVAGSKAQTLTVQLSPARLEVQGNRIEVADRVDFEVDGDDVLAVGLEVLADLARWLEAHPEVELLRIEGHADASGTSRHNHELSQRRAVAVRDHLVELGIDGDRLEPIGTGEARPDQVQDEADRRVEFLVLIWADAGG